MTELLGKLGRSVLGLLAQVGGMCLLFLELLRTMFTRRPRWGETVVQVFKMGWQSQSVVIITGAFTGMVFAEQTYQQFHKVKIETAVGTVVSISMLRELAPVLTALMLSGRVGAAIAAELGTMKVTEQLDALRAMGTSPVDYLAVPRFVALLLAVPLLTAEAMFFGIFSGYFIGVKVRGIDEAYFLKNMYQFTEVKDVMSGLLKAVCFAVFIGIISCYKGFHAGEGAEGVGRATTQAVVVSSLTVLISNFFIAVLFNTILPP